MRLAISLDGNLKKAHGLYCAKVMTIKGYSNQLPSYLECQNCRCGIRRNAMKLVLEVVLASNTQLLNSILLATSGKSRDSF